MFLGGGPHPLPSEEGIYSFTPGFYFLWKLELKVATPNLRCALILLHIPMALRIVSQGNSTQMAPIYDRLEVVIFTNES